MEYHNDPYLDIYYNKRLNSTVCAKNVVGASASILRSIDYTPTDANTVFISESGLDENTGISSAHVCTFARALALLTQSRGNILFCDSKTYYTESIILPVECTGIYAQVLCTPTLIATFGGVCVEHKIIKAVSAMFSAIFSNTILSNAGCPVYPPACTYDDNFSHKIVGSSGRIGSYIVNVHRRHIVFCDDDGTIIWTSEVFPESSYTKNESSFVESGSCYASLGSSVIPIPERAEFIVVLSYSHLDYEASASTVCTYTSYTKIYMVDLSGATFIETITHASAVEDRATGATITNGSTCPRPFRSPRSCGILSDGNIFIDMTLYTSTSVVSSTQRVYQYNTTSKSYTLLKSLSIPFSDISRPVMYGIKDGTIINNAMQGGINIYDEDGVYLKTVSFALQTFDVLDIIPMRSGWMLAGRGADGIYISSITSSGNIHIDSTKVSDASARDNIRSLTGVQMCSRQDYVVAIYFDTTAEGKIVVVAENGKHVCSYDVDRCCQVTISDSADGDIIAFYSQALKNELNRIRFSWSIFDHSSPLNLNGLTLRPENTYNCCFAVISRGSINAKNNTFLNVHAANETNFTFLSFAIYSPVTGYSSAILNNKVVRCGGGFYFGDSDVVIKYNQVYRHTHSFGILISGKSSSTTLNIQHNDICYGVGGIKLLNNTDISSSTIIIKNNIIYKNILGAFDATAEISIDYNMYTGVMLNVLSGAHNIATDPFYRNGGYDNIDNTDLTLSSKVLGDSVDSIGLNCADDGTNLGSLDVEYTYIAPSWTIARFKKQYIDIQYEPVGGYLNQKKSGKSTGKKDATIKSVTLNTDGLPNAEFKHYLAMHALTDNLTVLLKLDPITNPNISEEFLLDPTTTLKGSPPVWRLSRSGVVGSSLRFIRAYIADEVNA